MQLPSQIWVHLKLLLRRNGIKCLKKNRNEGFFTTLATEIKKDPTMSIRKHTNELKVYKETVRTAIKQDLSPDSLDYTIWGVLENKTNATSHPNMGLLKAAIEEEWNKMTKEFFLKAWKLFRRCVEKIIEKNRSHIE